MNNNEEKSLNWFEADGDKYAKYRPEYPEALGKALADLTTKHHKALDVGCGTGQLTQILADNFDEVMGIDPSEAQIMSAVPKDNIHYSVGSAELLPSSLQEIDLITIAQAAHWVDLPKFYAEAKRVSAKDGIIALISYGVFASDEVISGRLHQFYYDEIGSFWPPERKMVDEGYKNIEFPFTEIAMPPMEISLEWNLDELIGYISTWSAVRKALSQGKENILVKFHQELSELWGDKNQRRRIQWPINMRVGKLFINN